MISVRVFEYTIKLKLSHCALCFLFLPNVLECVVLCVQIRNWGHHLKELRRCPGHPHEASTALLPPRSAGENILRPRCAVLPRFTSVLFYWACRITCILSVGATATPAELRERLIEKLRLVLASGSDEECSVCLDSVRLPVITHCAHVYCRPCITQVIGTEQVRLLPSAGSGCYLISWWCFISKTELPRSVFCACGQEKARCPLCRHEIKTSELVEFPPEELEEEGSLNSQNWGASSKVRYEY